MVITRLYSLRHNLFQPSFKPALSLPPRWDLTEDGVGLGKNGTWENDEKGGFHGEKRRGFQSLSHDIAVKSGAMTFR